ncbi:MAG: FHA domain-containing protein [Acidobacteriia bacterium]|nr:FHA domain-containing protein [Terriglobia bacterium]
MRAFIGVALALFLRAAPVLADTQLRLEGFDTSSLPKVFGVFDQRSGTARPPDLAPSEFRLLEDGQSTSAAIRKLPFRDTGAGLGLVVAIDASRSMEGRPVNAIRQGLVDLVSRKRPEDRVSVLTFADDIHWETRWDAQAADTQQAFQKLATRGNLTRLYDAVLQTMDELQSEAHEDSHFPPRLCILVLSDGHDEGSRASLGQVVSRLQASHFRLDTVGLARSPLWLRNLQALADAGFGGFRSASAPEDLKQLLNHGIDALLDSPALEFRADRLTRDGKAHQLGMEYLTTHWRDQVSVTLPESSWVGDRRVEIGGALALVLVVGSWLYYYRSRRTRAEPVALSQPAPVPVPPVSYHRTETAVEIPAEVPTVRSRYVPTAPEPRAEDPPPPPKPARVGTVLAPQKAAQLSLAATAGPYAGRRFTLNAHEFWIGSANNNHLCLSADPAVSGNHACIRWEEGFLRLYDNGSLNNTLVNGRPIGTEVVLLHPGDRIHIGQSELRLEG